MVALASPEAEVLEANRSDLRAIVFDLGHPSARCARCEALRRFHRLAPEVPVIATTTCDRTHERGVIDGVECAATLLKPLYPVEMARLIRLLRVECAPDGAASAEADRRPAHHGP